MATRTFCDHCGNAVTEHKEYSFGPKVHPIILDPNGQRIVGHQVQFMNNGSVGIQGNSPPSVQTIDLCAACIPVWMERVRRLTGASDV
jgi:hypothetical protein